MKSWTSWFWIVVALCCLFCFWSGCPLGQSMDASKLPGVWRSSEQGINVIWTFESSGSFRYQAQFQNSWIGFFGGNFDIAGHWKLDQNRLTIELSETPPAVALAGENWSGRATTIHIQRLNNTELRFSDASLQFRRSLVPAN